MPYYKVSYANGYKDRIIRASSAQSAAEAWFKEEGFPSDRFAKVVFRDDTAYKLYSVILTDSGSKEVTDVEHILEFLDPKESWNQRYLLEYKQMKDPTLIPPVTFGCNPDGEHVGGGHMDEVLIPRWKKLQNWAKELFSDHQEDGR
jgi:hypothetical protein